MSEVTKHKLTVMQLWPFSFNFQVLWCELSEKKSTTTSIQLAKRKIEKSQYGLSLNRLTMLFESLNCSKIALTIKLKRVWWYSESIALQSASMMFVISLRRKASFKEIETLAAS